MKFIATPFTLVLLAISSALAITVSFDTAYDDKNKSLNSVICSNGDNGLLTKGFTSFGSLPSFPFIAGAAVIEAWNSDKCGTCWELTYKDKTIHVLAIDRTDSGFNIAKEAMDKLTGNQAAAIGRVDAIAKQVGKSVCGLK